jgi:hypothetical protein
MLVGFSDKKFLVLARIRNFITDPDLAKGFRFFRIREIPDPKQIIQDLQHRHLPKLSCHDQGSSYGILFNVFLSEKNAMKDKMHVRNSSELLSEHHRSVTIEGDGQMLL